MSAGVFCLHGLFDMKRIAVVLFTLALAACTQAPPPQTQPPTPPPSPNRLTPLTTAARTIEEPRIRVGLLSDQPGVTFPRINDGYFIVADAGPNVIRRGFTVTAPLSESPVRFAVQVSSVSDQASAEALAQKIRAEVDQPVNLIFDPAGGAYRVQAGDFPDNDAAIPLRNDLITRGYAREMTIVRRPAAQQFEKVHQIVDDEGDRYTLRGDSILIMPATAETITIDRQPYRTAARLFINARGLLNVINELNLEDYLYGVVPAEMGPRVFDELEALKAQATAARTYAVRNMGQFATEGYDICPGPACQAYKGFGGEEPLSNQAVDDTAGMVITHEGKPINALYTSTCGGETSDVGTMFPGGTDPYLKRARCVELDMVTLAGRGDSGLLTEQQANARLFVELAQIAEPRNWTGRDVETAVAAAVQLVGAAETTVRRPASSRRGDVLRYLADVFRLHDKARIVTLPEDRKYFFPQTADPDAPEYLAAAFLIKYGILPAQNIDRADMNAAMPREELYALLLSWLREAGALQEANGKISAVSGRSISLKAEGKTNAFTLPDNIPIFRRVADRLQEYREVPVMIGDRASIFRSSRGVPVAVVVHANFDGASFDRTSSFANWTRSYRADEIVPVMNRRNPIQQLVDIRPVVVDASKRIAELEVTAEGGRKFMLRGLPIRWSLNVPDNLFAYDKTRDADGMDRYTFYGKGWGHGTGFCQVGSYGMAFRGYKYEQILKHYYTGIEIVRLEALGGVGLRR